MIPTKEELIISRDRITPYIHQTPVHSSVMINEIIGLEVFFKCENFQKMGAFKMRGASNAVLKLTQEQRDKGVTTHSSGNFAQAVALSAKLTNTKATIVMPSNAPEVKKKAVIGYGATVIDCEPTLKSREETAQKVVNELGATLLHPYNCYDVIAGNASATLELMEQRNGLNAIFTPVGGGGLISGTALAAHYFSPIKVYGAEPLGADDAYRSFKTGKLIPMVNPKTIADGLRTSLGNKGFEIIKQHVVDIYTVEEQDIINAMKLVWERMKIIIEPSSAVPLAALINQKEKFKGQKIGIIISGGNVDLKHNYFK
jgi:threonine dehydratase